MSTATVERLREKLTEARKNRDSDAVRFMTDNPAVPFVDVGRQFGMSGMQASRLWARAGFPARKSGRKAGISPLKKELRKSSMSGLSRDKIKSRGWASSDSPSPMKAPEPPSTSG